MRSAKMFFIKRVILHNRVVIELNPFIIGILSAVKIAKSLSIKICLIWSCRRLDHGLNNNGRVPYCKVSLYNILQV